MGATVESGSIRMLCDEPHLTIVQEGTAVRGEVNLSEFTLDEVEARAADLGLMLTYADVPFYGERIGWFKLYFAWR